MNRSTARTETGWRNLLWCLVVGVVLIAAAGPDFPHPGKTRPTCLNGIPARDYKFRGRSPSQIVMSRTAVLLFRPGTDRPLPLKQSVAVRNESTKQIRPGGAGHDGQILVVERESRSREENKGGEARNSTESLYRKEYRASSTTTRQLDEKKVVIESYSLPKASDDSDHVITHFYDLDRPKLEIDHCSISGVVLQVRSDGRWVLNLRADQNPLPAEGREAEYNPKLHIKRNQFVLRLRCLGNARHAVTPQAAVSGRPVLAVIDVPEFWVERREPRFVRFKGEQVEIKEFFDRIDRVEVEFYYR